MFDNQLDFSNTENTNYFIFQSNVGENNNNTNYYEDSKNYQIQGHLNSGEIYQTNNENYPQFNERLDYMVQQDLNEILLKNTPQPLIFQNSHINLSKKCKNKYNNYNNYNNKSLYLKSKKNTFSNKNSYRNNIKITKTPKTQIQNFTTNLSTPNPKGLFDTNLKRNELDFPKKTQLQRMERINKIKNYDVKFGNKLNKLQMYDNYMDLFEDMENIKMERKYNHKSVNNIKNNNKNEELLKIRKEIQELEQRLPKPLKINQNNLNFNFNEQELIVKSLEDQIERERKMRADVNMKYFQKMKELEEMKGKNKNKTQNLNNNYRKKIGSNYNINKVSKFKRQLNKSVDIVKRNNKFPDEKMRNKSADIVKEKMKEIMPGVNNMIDKHFNTLYKNVIKKNKNLLKKVYMNSNTNLIQNKNDANVNKNSKKLNINLNEEDVNVLYDNFSENIQNLNQNYKNNENNENFQNNENNENFQKMNKYEMLTSLNKEINQYNRGLPKLLEKVETTIDKINKVNILDDKLHPIIKLASKHSGKLIHFHIEEIVDSIIDDFLIESVYDLERIEKLENKKIEKQNFKSFVKDYYQNFNQIKNLELEVNDRLHSKFYVKKEKIKEKDDDRIKIYEYKNPFEQIIENNSENNFNKNVINITNAMTKYKTKMHPNLIKQIEKYSKDFNEYLKTTGAYYFPNIFLIYDELIQEIVDDCLDTELNYCVRQLDDFVTDIYKEEVFNSELK